MKNNILIIIMLCGIFEAAAQQQTLTLERCREMALENNRAGAIAEKTAEKTGYESKSYFANFFPKFSLSGAYMFTDAAFKKTIAGAYLPTFVPDLTTGALQPNIVTMPDGSPVIGADGNPVFREYAYFPDMSFDLKMSGTYFAGLRAEQPVYMGGKIVAAYRMSQIGKDIAALNKQLTRAEIIVRTDEAYWLHVKAVESLKVAQAFQSVVSELLKNVSNAQKTGLKSRNDVLKVQVQFNKAQLQVHRAENAIALSRMNLCQVVGLAQDARFEVSGSMFQVSDGEDRVSGSKFQVSDGEIASYLAMTGKEGAMTGKEGAMMGKEGAMTGEGGAMTGEGGAMTPPDSSLITHHSSLSIEFRPEYGILAKQVDLKSQQIKLVRSDFLPNIGIGANYGYMRGLELNGTPLLDKASFSAIVTVSIPVFHWGEGMNKIRAARAEKQIAELQREEMNEKMELEAMQARQRLSEAAMEAVMTARALEQAAENMRESRDRYEAGMESLADYLEAQTIHSQAGL
ncbi:MAG: TolC family protein, partial [Tannerella sp.]|nr:TolC family protein [Tannerella sp.]